MAATSPSAAVLYSTGDDADVHIYCVSGEVKVHRSLLVNGPSCKLNDVGASETPLSFFVLASGQAVVDLVKFLQDPSVEFESLLDDTKSILEGAKSLGIDGMDAEVSLRHLRHLTEETCIPILLQAETNKLTSLSVASLAMMEMACKPEVRICVQFHTC